MILADVGVRFFYVHDAKGNQLNWSLFFYVLVLSAVISAAVVSFFLYPVKNSGDMAAWIQAIASAVAIAWSGRQGRNLLQAQRAERLRDNVKLTIDVLESIHTYLNWVWLSRFSTGELLKKVGTTDNFFDIESLGPLEKLLDQMNMEILSHTPLVKSILTARQKIWRIREFLQWITNPGRELKDDRYQTQSERLKEAIDAVEACIIEVRLYQCRIA